MISVCIPTVRSGTIGDAIGSVLRQTHEDWELIVVGQGDDPTLERAVRAASGADARARYVHVRTKNASLARNTAAEQARGDVVAFIDDDCEAAPNWLATIDRCFRDEPDTDVVGGAVIAPAAERRGPSTCPDMRPSESLYDPAARNCEPPEGWTWMGANVAVRRALIDEVGGFDACLGPGATFPAAEDVDWKLRMERAGIRMRATPRSVVFHTHGRRYGLRAGFAVLRGYALGMGALAAKLEMQGDRRGPEWVRALPAELGSRPLELPRNALRAAYLWRGYEACRRGYRLDATGRFLEKRA